jgi:predicted CXXCH cytochrome family protein
MKKSDMKPITTLTAWLLSATIGLLVVSCGTAPVKKTEAPKEVAKKCLECHPEFSERFSKGNVHAPIREGDCYACHRPHGIFGKVIFRADQPALCYSCHPAVQPQDTAKSVHKPLTTAQCSTCHNPHNSDYAGLLAAEGKESCFICHDREDFQQQFVHQPLSQGCNTCHIPHSSENVSLLQQAPDDNCKSCHDVTQAGFIQAHFQYPVTAGCTLCHSPHSATSKDLLKKVVHEPVRKGQCDSCHAVGANTEIQTRQEADKLCLQCHDITHSATSTHQPYVQGQCTVCHDVHASNYTVLLVDAPERICLTCHAAIAGAKDAALPADGVKPAEQEATEKTPAGTSASGTPPVVVKAVSLHQPVSEGQCLACHKGHVSEQKSMLKAAPGKLCLDCHEQGYTAAAGSHPADSGQECATCHVPHQSGVRALLRGDRERDLCFSCHKNISVERGRFSLHKPFAQGNCGGCHLLHRPKASAFLAGQYSDGRLCLTCHEEKQKGAENFVSHAPVSRGQCNKCHSPHAADYDHVLRSPEGELCFGCHQPVRQKYEGAAVKHQPLAEGKCTSCHTAHGSPYANILTQNQPKLCLECHVSVGEFWIEGVYHEPATKDCLQCHNAHGSDLPAILVKPGGELCRQCHDTKTDAFSKAHNQINPRPESCVSCHSPHGSPVKSMLYPVVHKPFAERSCSPCHPGR